MLNREYKTENVLSYTNATDSYGQRHKGATQTTQIEMVAKLYTQSNVQDPRYIDVDMIGITKYSGITTENEIVIDGKKYQVLYVIPSGKLNQVLMKCLE